VYERTAGGLFSGIMTMRHTVAVPPGSRDSGAPFEQDSGRPEFRESGEEMTEIPSPGCQSTAASVKSRSGEGLSRRFFPSLV
jgi:hypothetical protein